MWKTSKREETFIRQLYYLIVVTEKKIQSSAAAINEVRRCVIESLVDENSLRVKLFEERFYELTHTKALPMVKNVFGLSLRKFFSTPLFHEI